MTKTEKIVNMDGQPLLPAKINGTMKPDKAKEERTMLQDTYSKEEIDKKFDKLESKIDNLYTKTEIDLKFEALNQKIDFSVDRILSETRNMLLEQQIKEKTERESERKTTNRWLVGIAISVAGLVISIIVNFFTK